MWPYLKGTQSAEHGSTDSILNVYARGLQF